MKSSPARAVARTATPVSAKNQLDAAPARRAAARPTLSIAAAFTGTRIDEDPLRELESAWCWPTPASRATHHLLEGPAPARARAGISDPAGVRAILADALAGTLRRSKTLVSARTGIRP